MEVESSSKTGVCALLVRWAQASCCYYYCCAFLLSIDRMLPAPALDKVMLPLYELVGGCPHFFADCGFVIHTALSFWNMSTMRNVPMMN